MAASKKPPRNVQNQNKQLSESSNKQTDKYI